MNTALLELRPEGLYCAVGDFYVDPWRPVPRAVVTHAHSDHARWGCDHYLFAQAGEHVFKTRLGEQINATMLPYGNPINHHGVRVTLFPAGHVLGSSQVRLEHRGEVVVVSGDYKLADDPTCVPFEPISCDYFLSESTFGLPIYRWEEPAIIAAEINRWWRQNRDHGKASVVYAYALGKAQRILALLDPSIGPIICHGAIERLNRAYRASQVALPETKMVTDFPAKTSFAGAIVIATPSAQHTSWLKRFEPYAEASASGWMAVRGIRRRRGVDHGFILSDHADWQSLIQAIKATGAQSVGITHGYTESFSKFLCEQGLNAEIVSTRFEGEVDEPEESVEVASSS